MRIYIDFDDVLCETARGLSELAGQMFGRQVPFECIHEFDLQISFQLNRDQYLDLMEAAHEPEFLLNRPALPGCVAVVQGWLAKGYVVEVVTGRPSSTHQVSHCWLEQQGLGMLPVLYVDKYNRNHSTPLDAPPALSMPELLQQHFDLVVDDSPMVLDVLRTRAAGRTVVFDRPWNRTYDCPGGRVMRCCGWTEVAAVC